MASKTIITGDTVKREAFEPTLKGASSIQQKKDDSGNGKNKKGHRRVVFYLRLEDEATLEKVRATLIERGKKKDRSALIREAINDLRDKYNVR